MQAERNRRDIPYIGSGKGRWIPLAVGIALALAGCQAPHAGEGTPTGPVASSGATAPVPAAVPTSAAEQAPAAGQPSHALSAADLAMEAEDMGPDVPDDSYRRANLRPQYSACVDASDAVTPALQACGDEELAWQEHRMVEAFGKIADGPDGRFKDEVMDDQAAYMLDTKRHCSWNPAEDGQGQMLDAQSCRINRTANRADQLEALISK